VKAVQITSLTGPAHLALTDVPEPEPGTGEVLIRVEAAGVAFPQLLQSRGKYQHQPPLPFIPGAEVAGTVISAPASPRLRPGDRVAALVRDGGFAEVATAEEDMVFRLPDSVTTDRGAAIPVNYLTGHFSLVHRGALRPGEAVLVHGASGGVGSASVQVAKVYGADRVIAVASTAAKLDVALAAGADDAVLTSEFVEHARAIGGVDIVVDPVGGDSFTDSLRSLRDDGRLIVVGFAAGSIPTVKVNRLLLRNLSVVGAGLGAYTASRPGYELQQWEELLPHIASGALSPPAISSYPLAKASQALLDIEARKATGKIVLIP
jgi:NADPH2:quinone reductase